MTLSNEQLKKALADCKCADASTLYFALLKFFTDADTNRDGSVDPVEFDQMIDGASGAGFLPASGYKTPEERLAGHKAIFAQMDENNDGQISLDEWLGFCHKSIGEKCK